MTDKDPSGPLITVQDVHNVVREHMVALDQLWPDDDRYGPRKVHIVELIDAIKLRLIQRAEANINQYVSPFEKAAKKIMGTQAVPSAPAPVPQQDSKSAMHQAMEQARKRIEKGRQT